MRAVLLATSLIAAAPVSAVEGWVDLHIGSIHSDDHVIVDGTPYDMEGENPGIGVRLASNENVSLRLGTYRNSFDNTSNYIALDSHTTGPLVIGVSLGIVSGYKLQPTDSNIKPMVVPHIGYEMKYMRAELSYLHGGYSKAVALTVGFPFKF